MTAPNVSTADIARALVPALTTDDTLFLLADCLNQLEQRGASLTFNGGVESQWADVQADSEGVFGVVYYTEGSAEDAIRSISRTAQLDQAKELAEQLLIKELNNAGSGRSGHLTEDDLRHLLKVLDA